MNDPLSPGRIVRAGLLSGAAFLVEQTVDQAIWPQGYNDMQLLGLVVTRRRPLYLAVAVPCHLLNSLVFAWVYATVAGPRLPGPGWLRGLIFALVENNVLWFTLMPATNRIHPAVRDGSMPAVRIGPDWLVGNLRHVALGIVLGRLCPVAESRGRT